MNVLQRPMYESLRKQLYVLNTFSHWACSVVFYKYILGSTLPGVIVKDVFKEIIDTCTIKMVVK